MSEQTQPPAKRQRTEDPPAEEIIRSQIWYDDGSVILQAEFTQCRVHWTVLAQHSPFFANLRGVPQPPNEPLIEGCPVIQLSDSIQDLEHLLRTLYNPLFDSATQLEFPVVAAIVRLGKKYDFSHLLTAAVARLSTMFPATLAGDIKRRQKSVECIRDDGGLLFDTINLVNETGLLALLPPLYFETMLNLEGDLGLDALLVGVYRIDETAAKLSLNSQVTLTRARREITLSQARLMFNWLNPGHLPCGTCTVPSRCAANRDMLARQIFIPLYVLRAMHKWTPHWDRHFCTECRKASKAAFDDGSQRFWDMLPGFFELPDWEDLKNDI